MEVAHRTHESCGSSPANEDDAMRFEDLNLGSEFLAVYPSPNFDTAAFRGTIASMCFRFPRRTPRELGEACARSTGGSRNPPDQDFDQ
jgi:hypothetical protein